MNVFLHRLLVCVAVAIGLLGTLTWLMLILMGMANMTPEQLVGMRRLAWGSVFGGLAVTVAAAWLVGRGQTWWGLGLSISPLLLLVLIAIWIEIRR